MKKWVLTAGGLSLVWVMIRGAEPANLISEIITGMLISFPLIYIFRRMYPGEIALGTFAGNIIPMISYTLKFVEELLTANLDMARRVLDPSMPIDPDVIEVDLRTENPKAITVLANSITLTPGTVTLDHEESSNKLLVHSIDASDRSEVLKPIRFWEEKLLKITGEER